MTIIEPAPPRTRRRGRSALWWLLVLPGVLWAAVRLGGWERGPLVQLFAFTPYVAAWSVPIAVLALIRRRWIAGSFAVVAALPWSSPCCRAVPDEQPAAA